MSLIFKPLTAPVEAPQKTGFQWDAWYAKNKARLSEKRAKRYREDPAYRQAALARSRQQRGTKKPSVAGAYTVSFNEAAQSLGVTVWVLREWRRKNYFPEPQRRDGRLWFSPHQIDLLRNVAGYFVQHGPRVSAAHRQDLENLVSLTYANWGN